MDSYEELEKIHTKAINILRDNNIFTYLSLFIERRWYILKYLYSDSITMREPSAIDKRFEADPTEGIVSCLIFKPGFNHYPLSIHTEPNQSPINLQISINEKSGDDTTLECLIFENDNLVLDFEIRKSESEHRYDFSKEHRINIQKVFLSKTWFACLEVIYNRIIELDLIENDERLRKLEEENRARIKMLDLGEFD